MKKLSKINEGTLWGNTIMRSDTDKVRKEDEITEEYVRSYLDEYWGRDCHKIIIRREGDEQIVDIEGNFTFNDKLDIEQLPFQFGTVTERFDISGCVNLTSLKGCPEEVGGDFDCYCCVKLTSLEGCPKKVGGSFSCSNCNQLTSLEGCPKKVGGDFYCINCGKKFTKYEVRQHCDVIKSIIV